MNHVDDSDCITCLFENEHLGCLFRLFVRVARSSRKWLIFFGVSNNFSPASRNMLANFTNPSWCFMLRRLRQARGLPSHHVAGFVNRSK